MKRLTQWTVLVALAVVAGFASAPAQAAVTKYWDETSEQFSFEGSAIGTDVHNGVSPFSNWGLLYTNGRAKVADRAGTLEFMEVNSTWRVRVMARSTWNSKTASRYSKTSSWAIGTRPCSKSLTFRALIFRTSGCFRSTIRPATARSCMSGNLLSASGTPLSSPVWTS